MRVDLTDSRLALIASWSVYELVGKMLSKLARLVFVIADSRLRDDGVEEFHFNEAYLLQEPNPEVFVETMGRSKICVDIRMHLKKKGQVRNHGTGIRIREIDLPELFVKRETLM